MNLIKLFDIQKVLDAAIIEKKGLEGRDTLPEKILALQVELGECANEWRGFKFWSENQKSRTRCEECKGTGYCHFNGYADHMQPCEECNGYPERKNPLLEEYVDCLHFILSIGLEREETTMTGDYDESWITKTSSVREQFSHLFDEISNFSRYKAVSDYASVLDTFIGLGEMLGFTWGEIESAYMAKNEVNHSRQNNGY